MTDVEVRVDRRSLARLVAALSAEADGRELRRDLRRGLRAAAEPAAALARGSILAMGVGGLDRAVPPLRTAIAAATKVQVHTGLKSAGVAVRVGKTTMPRGFRNAPKRLNARKGWRHPVFGTDRWVTQRGKPGWFDLSMKTARPTARAAVGKAMDDVARRIDRRTRG